MSFQSIPGQMQAKRMLQSGLRQDSLSHAYLFHGPAGTGKQEMAFILAQAIFCTELKDDACGYCLECRKTANHNHPDLVVIEPDGSSIKIEQIRALQKEFSYRATSSQRKIYIIHHTDRMTVQAANSLLKFLEEPLSNALAVLITDNGHAVLPTIQSRAQWIPFTPLAPKVMIPILAGEGFPEELINASVHLASGLKAARELLQLNWFAELRTVMIQLAKECLTGTSQPLITIHHKVVKADLMDHINTLLDLFILCFKDMVNIQSGRHERIIFTDHLDWISRQAYSRHISHWVFFMEQAVSTQKKIRFHANPQLALEQFIIGMEGGEHSIV